MDATIPRSTRSNIYRAFPQLPDELALHIFEELAPNDTLRLQRVSKTWQSMLTSLVNLRRQLARYDHFSDGMQLSCEMQGKDEQTVLNKKLEVIHRFSRGHLVSAFSIPLVHCMRDTEDAILCSDILALGPDVANNIKILNLRTNIDQHTFMNGPNSTGTHCEDGVFSWHGVHYKTHRPTLTSYKVAPGIHRDTTSSSTEPSFHIENCIIDHLPKGSFYRRLFGKTDDHWDGGAVSILGNSLFVVEVHERVLTILSFDPDLRINAETFGFYETEYECIRYLF